jgi:pimeloyl-ACP methyl ester carboxylesterase
LKNLIHDAIEKTTDLVEETQESVAAKQLERLSKVSPEAAEVAGAVDGVRRVTSRTVYETIRVTNRGISVLNELGLTLAERVAAEAAALAPEATGEGSPLSGVMRSPAAKNALWFRDLAEGALNGFIGDFLRDRENGLHIEMAFRHRSEPLPLTRQALEAAVPAPTNRLCIFVHGLACTEWAWTFLGEQYWGERGMSFGKLLSRDFGYTPFYVRYNTGVHVSENGRRLSELIGELVQAHPVPVDEVVLVGHSMGGLVARSAAHYGAEHKTPWLDRVTHLFCIGSPHFGAPLEKASNVLASVLRFFDTPGTQVPAKILNARSSGIKDLRFGYVVDEDWKGRDPDAFLEDNSSGVPFVPSVMYGFVGSTLTRDPNHPVGVLLGDVLVRLPSAAGWHKEESRRIPFHRGSILGGIHHLELMNHPEVYDVIRKWLSPVAKAPPRRLAP